MAQFLEAARGRMPAVTVHATRDGRVNFKLPASEPKLPASEDRPPDGCCDDGQISGRSAWFGRTSIPLTRATALIDQFQAGHANVMLLGIGEGSEVDLLLSRLAPHRAVFVWEPEPTHLLLAMRLHDWANAIESDRLVFVLPSPSLNHTEDSVDLFAGLREALLATLERRPGHYCPERILLWPWYTAATIGPCRATIEAVYSGIERQRKEKLAEVQQRIAALPVARASGSTDAVNLNRSADTMFATTSPQPIALLSIHSHDETRALADGLVRAARQIDWPMAEAGVCGPGDVHPLARASRLADGLKSQPIAVVLLDTTRAEVADVLPATVSAISWLTHRASIANIRERIGPADRIWAVDALLADSLKSAGIKSKQISVVPLPCLLGDEFLAEGVQEADGAGAQVPQVSPMPQVPDWSDRPIDVAILAHLSPTDPDAYGHALDTHVRVWSASLERLRERVDKLTDADIPAVMTAAESAVRMRIDHPTARNDLAKLLGGPVIATLIWQDVVQHLAKSGIKVECWGHGWPDMASIGEAGAGIKVHSGPLPSLAERAAIYKQAKCVIFASPTGVVPADVLLAAAAGAVVVWRKHRQDSQLGGFSTLLKPTEQAVVYTANRDLPRLIRSILTDGAAWRKIVTAARQRCQTDHHPSDAIAKFKAAVASL